MGALLVFSRILLSGWTAALLTLAMTYGVYISVHSDRPATKAESFIAYGTFALLVTWIGVYFWSTSRSQKREE